jgi:hypothetical protein
VRGHHVVMGGSSRGRMWIHSSTTVGLGNGGAVMAGREIHSEVLSVLDTAIDRRQDAGNRA